MCLDLDLKQKQFLLTFYVLSNLLSEDNKKNNSNLLDMFRCLDVRCKIGKWL